ncbi:unnamed protein product [Linum tenue]|uniref:Uncharacterized protein n=1 Tax=Linum tenue TaxID=586396 RepID=A0AAV0GUC3_9ROSI|nr:unnamed protein product [Linum tenue]
MKTNIKKRRVAVASSYQSESFDDEEARFRERQKVLFQEFLNLQKEFASKQKKLETAKQRRQTLMDEVRFLRQRHTHLLTMQSDEQEQQGGLLSPPLRIRANVGGEPLITEAVNRMPLNGSISSKRGQKKKKKKPKTERNDFLATHELLSME